MSALDPLITPPPSDDEPKTVIGVVPAAPAAEQPKPMTRSERALFVVLYALRVFAFSFVCGFSFAVCSGWKP